MDAIKSLTPKQSVEITVWDANDDDFEYIFKSTIVSVADNLFLIEEPLNVGKGVLALLEKGVVVGVVVYADKKPVIIYPTVYSQQEKTPRGYWFKIPDDAMSETIQRRSHVRVEMKLPIVIEYEDSVGITQEMEGQTLDISGGGLKLTSSRGFVSTQEVSIYLNFYPELEEDEEPDETLILPAKIVFSTENPKAKGAKDFYITAVQFTDLPDKYVTKIMGECFKKELERKQGKKL